MIMKIIEYIKETRGELTHVSWPTKRQAISYTIIVVVFSIITSLYLGAFDFLFTILLEKFI